jgi:hypothetical protein
VLGILPRLQEIGLSCHPNHTKSLFPLVSSIAIGNLMQSSSLQNLSLCRLGLEDEHLHVIAEHLPSSRRLIELRLDGNLHSHVGILEILESLRQNPPSLTFLSMVESKPSNRSHLSLLSSVDWSSIFQTNSTLQTLVLFDKEYLQIGLFQFWLRLNRLGRSKWMEESSDLPSSLWALVLERVSNDSSALWYLLRSFPDQIIGL